MGIKEQIMISKNYIGVCLFFSILFFSKPLIAQNPTDLYNLSDKWEVLFEKDGLTFYVRNQECTVFEGQKPLIYSFLRIENTNSESKKVDFNFGLQFQEGCSGCDPYSEYSSSIEINANSILEGNCLFEENKLIRLINNPNLSGGWKYEKTIITNVTIQ